MGRIGTLEIDFDVLVSDGSGHVAVSADSDGFIGFFHFDFGFIFDFL